MSETTKTVHIDIAKFFDTVYGGLSGQVQIWTRRTEGGPVNAWTTYDWPEQRDQMLTDVEWNSLTTDTYYTVHCYDLKGWEPTKGSKSGRKIENATFTNVIYSDSDTCNPSNFRVPPSIVLETSPGRWHSLWLLDKPAPALDAANLSHKIAIAHKDQGADISSWSANKILRVPGSINTSRGQHYLIGDAQYSGVVYTLGEIEAAYDDINLDAKRDKRISDLLAQIEDIPGEVDENVAPLIARIPVWSDVFKLLTQEPIVGSRSEMLFKLLMELVELEVFSPKEILSLAWSAKCSSKWREDSRGVSGLVADLRKALAKHGTQEQWELVEPDPEPVVEPEREDDRKPELFLTDDEREIAGTQWSPIDEYVNAGRDSYPRINEPYFRAGALVCLSALVGNDVFMRGVRGEKMPMGFYTLSIGESSTGKSEHMSMATQFLRALNVPDELIITSNVSSQGLTKFLADHAAQGPITMFDDEVSGFFSNLSDRGRSSWQQDLQELMNSIYEGNVRGSLRAGGGTLNTQATLSVWFSTTPAKIFDAVDLSMAAGGFLPRFVVQVGSNTRLDESDLVSSVATEDAQFEAVSRGVSTTPAVAQVAAMWRARIRKAQSMMIQKGPIEVRISNDANRKFAEISYRLSERFGAWDEYSQDREINVPASRRMMQQVTRLAGIYSLGNDLGQVGVISVNNLLAACVEAEIWMGNQLWMLRRMQRTEFQRHADEVEMFIAQQNGGVATSAKIYRRFRANKPFEVEQWLDALLKQGRVETVNDLVVNGRPVFGYRVPLGRLSHG